MLRTKRGFITVGVLTAGLIVGILGFVLGSTRFSNFIPGLGHKDSKTERVSVTKTETKPIMVKGPDGKMYPFEMTSTTTTESNGTQTQNASLFEKLSVLPRLWVILMILGLFFPPVAVIMGMVNQKLFAEAKRIVYGVEDGLKRLSADHPDAEKKMLGAMSNKYDESTKKLVRKIKGIN